MNTDESNTTTTPGKRPNDALLDDSERPKKSRKHSRTEVDLNKPEAVNFNQFIQGDGFRRYLPQTEWILPENFKVDSDGNTALLIAIRSGKIGAATALIRAGCNVTHSNEKGLFALSVAAQRGYSILVGLLIVDGGADVNAQSAVTGTNALIQACHFGHLGCVKLLLKHGADVEQANQKETTALMRASQEGHLNIVKELLGRSANVNRLNHERMTSLMLASQRGHDQVVGTLIRAGAHEVLNERTVQHSTALMLACKRGNAKVVRVLLAAGAEMFLRDTRGRTARDAASKKGHDDIANSLVPVLQNHLIRMENRLRRNYSMGILWSVLHKERGLLPLGNKALSIHQVKQKIDNQGISWLPYNKSRVTLIQAYTLPGPLFSNIVTYLPLPPIWEKLIRVLLMNRCHVDPNASIACLLDIIDEILLESDFASALDEAKVVPPAEFKSWDEWKSVASFGYRSSQNDKSPNSGVDRAWPNDKALLTALKVRRKALFLGLLKNQVLVDIMISPPYNMRRGLLSELSTASDIQSLTRRMSRGVSFDYGAAIGMYFTCY